MNTHIRPSSLQGKNASIPSKFFRSFLLESATLPPTARRPDSLITVINFSSKAALRTEIIGV